MMELTGKTVCRGIAIGKIKMYSKNEKWIPGNGNDFRSKMRIIRNGKCEKEKCLCL